MSTDHNAENDSGQRAGGGAPRHAGPFFDLTEREQRVLRFITERFIETARPIGSRSLAREHPEIDLSPASVRNTMSDLEARGYLDQPHTSAGRMPTERGYRAFVDELMERPELAADEKRAVRAVLSQRLSDTGDLLRESSRLLGRLTNLLGVVLSPRLSTSVLERLELVPLAAGRLMFVLSVRGGFVKTLVLEAEAEGDVRRHDLGRIVSILNERLGGLTLEEIRRTFHERTGDLASSATSDPAAGVVRLMRDEAALLFSEPAEGRLQRGGTQGLMNQPEFREAEDLRALIEMMEDEDRVVRLLEDVADASSADATGESEPPADTPASAGNDSSSSEDGLPGGASSQDVQALVSIGSEHREADAARAAERYSIVTSHFLRGEAVGTIGVLGPTRMDYGRVMALVENTARLMNRPGA
ncbi:MAG: heat-inducible transcription repressor HrcA [Bacteroidetes bacterium QS_9_68_14]|nr:MAG: heat-inducible transcription repressor HrcA [Bacteroidetes bacterium QS_9_68_14]